MKWYRSESFILEIERISFFLWDTRSNERDIFMHDFSITSSANLTFELLIKESLLKIDFQNKTVFER